MNDTNALIDQLAEAVEALANLPSEYGPPDLAAEQAALQQLSQVVEGLLEAAGAAELLALHDLCALFYEQILQLIAGNKPLTSAQRLGLEEWPTHVMLYLDAPQDPENLGLLVQHLQQPHWPQPLSPEDAQGLLELFGNPLPELADNIADTMPESVVAEAPAEVTASLEPTVSSAELTEFLPEPFDVLPGLAPTDSAEYPSTEAEAAESLPDWEPAPVLAMLSPEAPMADPAPAVAAELPDAEPVAAPVAAALPAAAADAAPEVDPTPADLLPTEATQWVDHASVVPDVVTLEPSEFGDQELPVCVADAGIPSEVSDLRNVTLSMAEQELLELLSAELGLLSETLDSLAQAHQASDPAALSLALENGKELLERIAGACEAVGLAGLGQAMLHIHSQLDTSLQPAHYALLNLWPQQALQYLQAYPATASTHTALLTYLQDAAWHTALEVEAAALLAQQLAQDQLQTEEPGHETPARLQQAQPADVSLAPPTDINPELLESLLQELPEQSGEFSQLIDKLSRGQGLISDLESARRIAHTLKGAANTVGVRGIAVLTHQLEDILEALVKAQTMPGALLADTLLRAADCLAAMSDAVQGNTDAPTDAQAVLQEVLDWANLIDREGLTQANVAAAPTHTAATGQTAPQPLPTATINEDSSPGETGGAQLRVAEHLVDELLRLVGENIILNSQLQDRLDQAKQRLKSSREQSQRFLQLGNELEQLVDIRGLGSQTRMRHSSEFDALELEEYHELHTLSRRLVEAATDAHALQQDFQTDLRSLDQLLEQQTQSQHELEERTLSTRMLPASLLAPRLQRGVRQAARMVDKPIDLHLTGTHTLIDSQVMQTLAEPLMHLLRNAIDHGIEAPAQRVAFGKPEAGQLQVHFSREGQSISVRCQDDGQGLNYVAIRSRAEVRGLVSPNQTLTEEQLTQLILQPGFSTRDDVTQISGRGVGMDVVNTWVQTLKGSLRIQSQAGRGTRFELRLPVSLMTTHGLLTACAGQRYVLAQRGIAQILPLEPDALKRLGKQQVYRHEQVYYPTANLPALLGLPEETLRTVLLVDTETGPRAVLAPILTTGREWVIKKLSRLIPTLPGLLGATILGDGGIAAVLDLPDLLRSAPSQSSSGAAGPLATTHRATTPVHALRALVVDDSLSARRALMQTLQDAGFAVGGARDGMEATQMLAQQRPDILFVDLEMPRMNGLELAHHVRNQPELRHLPILMITSRSTQKHRAEAEQAGVNYYLTKPFQDREVIEQAQRLLLQVQEKAG